MLKNFFIANREHIKWLREGVNSWNARRLPQKFPSDPGFLWPNFDGANLSSELQGSFCEERIILFSKGFVLDGINLAHGSFRNAILSGFSFKEANLNYAKFQGAYLSGADLTKAKLNGAELTGAYLNHANLRGAELSRADLSGAELAGANIEGADLSNAILRGTDITNTQPWTSILFPDPKDATKQHPNPLWEVTKVGDLVNIRRFFENYYENTLEGSSFNEGFLFYFRGEDVDWGELRPSVMRSSSQGEIILRNKEGEMLLELMARRPEDFVGATSAFSQWVIAQHHGLRTRLLDITRNPLVALFHACKHPSNSSDGILHVFVVPRDIVKTFDSDAISVVANLAKLPRSEQDRLMGKPLEPDKKALEEPFDRENKYFHTMDRLYHYIRQEKPHFKERIDIRDLFRIFVVEPQQSFERIRVQSGAFLISAFHEQFETGRILQLNKNIPVYHHYRLVVPANRKNQIRDELRFLNVTHEVLFPGLDETAKAIVKRYEEFNS